MVEIIKSGYLVDRHSYVTQCRYCKYVLYFEDCDTEYIVKERDIPVRFSVKCPHCEKKNVNTRLFMLRDFYEQDIDINC